MDIRLLGSIELWAGELRVDIGPRQQRLVLAVLALELNRHVTVQQLVDLIWPDGPPPRAVHAIHVRVSRLRAVLPPGAQIVTQGAGYALLGPPELVDVYRFRELVDRARATTDAAHKLAMLDEALALWRGPALADVELGPSYLHSLQEAKLVALEDRFDAGLELGMHRLLIEDLTGLVAAHPGRERLAGQLLMALHRSGRQTDALAAFSDLRERLAEQFGVDPGPALTQLHTSILRADPALSPPPPAADLATPPPAADPMPAPAQLPARPAGFAGRQAQLRHLDSLKHTAAMMIIGSAGVGKTSLALHWAHQTRHRFPDGQLYVNLRGHSSGAPMQPVEALSRFLRAMGVPAEEVPADADEAECRYRSLLADRRILVLLDNAVSPEQVRPLLPGGEHTLTLITSRDRLTGLTVRNGVRAMTLRVLPADQATALLAHDLGGQRIAAEPMAAAELAALCACLPLALKIATASLHPARSITDHVANLRSRGLSGLQIRGDDQLAVRVAFDHSYDALEPAVQELFRLLGLAPATEFTVQSAAALADSTNEHAQSLLDLLTDAHLLEEHRAGRYAFHDLLRSYAAELASGMDSQTARSAALDRFLDLHLRIADNAARLLYPQAVRVPAAHRGDATAFPGPAEAIAWLETERPTLVAAVRHAAQQGHHRTAWALSDTLTSFLLRKRYPHDLLEVATAGLESARDPAQRAGTHQALGYAHRMLDQLGQATLHYTEALALAREADWTAGESAALTNLGTVRYMLGELAEAAECYTQALATARRIGHTGGITAALNNLAMVEGDMGQQDASASHYEQILVLDRASGNLGGAAITLSNLGQILHRLGRSSEALDAMQQAVQGLREVGNRGDEMCALEGLAVVQRDLGQLDHAADHARQALAMSREFGHQGLQAAILNTLATIELRLGLPDRALDQQTEAIDIARQCHDLMTETAALTGRAETYLRLGLTSDAHTDIQQAITIARKGGFRYLEQEAAKTLARIDADEQLPA